MAFRVGWDEYFLEIARITATRSNCIQSKVGAVIVSPRRKIKSTGYNGTPHGVKSCLENGFCYRNANNIKSGTRYETCKSLHAEQNAIIQAGEDNSNGATLYIYGHDRVCLLCKRFIIQAGINRIVLKYKNDSPITEINPENWKKEVL